MKKKLIKLISEKAVVQFWNGHQIKRCCLPQTKFQYKGNRYNIELEIESRYNNVTDFEEVLCEPRLINWRTGFSSEGYLDIANQLELSPEEVEEIFRPMVASTKYTDDEKILSSKEYIELIIEFNKMFG